MGRKAAVKTRISPNVSVASSSVRPTLARSGWPDAADRRLGAHAAAAVPQRLLHRRPALLVEAAQHAIAAQHQVDVAAQPVEDAGELDGDIAAAYDGDALGQRIRQMKCFVGRDGE